MTDFITASLLELEARLDAAGWDADPAPFFLVTDPADPLGARVGVVPLPVDMTPWTAAPRPQRVFRALARLRPPPPDLTVRAVGFWCEAWSVATREDDVAYTDQLNAARRDFTFHAHPDRVEKRMVAAVDRHNHLYAVERARGREAELLAGPDVPGDGPVATGDVFRAIRAYAAVVFGW